MDKFIEFFQNKDPRQFYIYGFLIFILCILIFNFSFKNNIPTCNHYIMNVYLYLGLGITLVGLFSYLFEYYNVEFNLYLMFLFFILTIVFIILLGVLYKNRNYLLNHLLWLGIIIGFAYTLYPMVSSPTYAPFINRTLMIVALIFLLMTIIVYVFPKFFEENVQMLGVGLFVGLISIIIVELFYLIYKGFTKNTSYTNTNRLITYFVIILFSFFISYDTQVIKMKSRNCKETNSFRYPNYPYESLSFILDLLNLFVRILSLQGNN